MITDFTTWSLIFLYPYLEKKHLSLVGQITEFREGDQEKPQKENVEITTTLNKPQVVLGHLFMHLGIYENERKRKGAFVVTVTLHFALQEEGVLP